MSLWSDGKTNEDIIKLSETDCSSVVYNLHEDLLCVKEDLAKANERVKGLEEVIGKAMPELKEAKGLAMHNTLAARIPECGDFGCIAQSLDWVCNTLGELLVNSKLVGSELRKEQFND